MRHLFDQKTKLYPHQEQSLLKLHDLAVKGELNPQRSQGRKSAFLLIGVGCGKTVILQSAPYILGQHILGRQVIFLSDNCTLRQRVMDDFPTKQVGKKYVPNQQGWPLYKYGLLSPETPAPKIVELKPESNTYRFDYQAADILVTNRQFLINLVKNGVINPDAVGLIVVDEAHHSAAKTYLDIFNYFDNASLVFLTGSRKVDGTYQSNDVDFQSDNLAVVVTHDALGINELFNKFSEGEEAILLEEEGEEEEEIQRHRVLTDDYSAGDELLHLSSTDGLDTGDQVMVKKCDDFGKEQKYYFHIKDVVGNGTLKVTPLLVDIPKDSPARKSYNNDDDAIQFKGHIGLEWYLLIDGEHISINDYCRKQAIKRKGFNLDKDGEVVTSSGKKIKHFETEAYQLILEGIERESEKIEIPYSQLVSCRPDQEKKDRQQSYRKQFSGAIYNLLSDQFLVPDGKDGTSLIDLELECLKGCSQKTAKKNSDFLMSQIFGYVKRQTGKEWGDHQTDDEYESAKKLALEKLQEVRSEIKKRHGYKDLLDLIE